MRTRCIAGQLNYGRIAAYFRKCGATVYVQRVDHDDYLITDKLIMLRVSASPELAHFVPNSWEHAVFCVKEAGKETRGPDLFAYWQRYQYTEQIIPLVLTRELYEVPDDNGKPGILLRKLTGGVYDGTLSQKRILDMFSGVHGGVLFQKAILDVFSPDLLELELFQFEQMGINGPLRIAARNGYVALVMQCRLIKQGL